MDEKSFAFYCRRCGKELDGVTLDYGQKWVCSECTSDRKEVLNCERGSKVKAVNLDAGWDSDREQAHRYLTYGGIYEVESLHIGSWLSSIRLKEFPHIRFNTVHFERYEEPETDTVEILAGGDFSNAVKALDLTSAVCTHRYDPPKGSLRENYQIWKLSNEDFENLCSMDGKEWEDSWGWWSHSMTLSELFTNFLGDGSAEETEAQIKVRYLTPDIQPLEYIDGKSDWIDLRAAETVGMRTGDFKLIPLGVAMQLPRGYEAHIVPRSSTYKNFGMIQANHMGLIDESYCGDNDQWYFPAIALRDTVIRAGDRICQFRIMEHQPALRFKPVETLGNADRGGIGSTGKA